MTIFLEKNEISTHDLVAVLGSAEGLKLLGQCPDIQTLRKINAIVDQQRIDVRGYYNDTHFGGGEFYFDEQDCTSVDNGGTVIVTDQGQRWKRVLGDVITPLYFGAKADGITDDSRALNALCHAALANSRIDLLGKTYLAADIEITKPLILSHGIIQVAHHAKKGAIYVHDAENVVIEQITTIVDYQNKSRYQSANVSGIHAENCQNIQFKNCKAVGSKCANYHPTLSWGCTIHAFRCDGVLFSNCESHYSDKEGLMTRYSDNVTFVDCSAYQSGYSGLGTSGGNKVVVNNVKSFISGASAISINSRDCIIDNVYTQGNKTWNGLVIGHGHEVESYACSVVLNNVIVKDSAKNGIAVTCSTLLTMSNVVVDNVGINETGYGIYLDKHPHENCQVTLSNIVVSRASYAGIRHYYDGKATVMISNTTLTDCGTFGIELMSNGEAILDNVTINQTPFGILACSAGAPGTRRADSLHIKNSQFSTQQSAVILRGIKQVQFKGNHCRFNLAEQEYCVAFKIDGVVNGINIALPDFLAFKNNTFLGIVGTKNTSVIEITNDGNTEQIGQLKLLDNDFSDSQKQPIVFPKGRYQMMYHHNFVGHHPNMVYVEVLAGQSKLIANSHQTNYSMPMMIKRNEGECFVVSYAAGKIELANPGDITAKLMLIW